MSDYTDVKDAFVEARIAGQDASDLEDDYREGKFGDHSETANCRFGPSPGCRFVRRTHREAVPWRRFVSARHRGRMGLWGGGRRRAGGSFGRGSGGVVRGSAPETGLIRSPHPSRPMTRFLVARNYDMAPTTPDTRGQCGGG